MVIEIVPYTECWIGAVAEFNARLKAGNIKSKFPESHIPHWLPKSDGRSIFQDHYLAVGGNTVRGGYILKHQNFIIDGEVLSIGNYQLPLSEGIINKAYAAVGLQLLSDALRRQPLLYSLGIGGFDEPLTKMLKAMGWSIYALPFHAKILCPINFFKEISFLRRTSARRLLFDLIAYSGVGWCTVKLQRALSMKRPLNCRDLSIERMTRFDSWADGLWELGKGKYLMSAVRDSATLNILYPEADQRFIILKIGKKNRVIGWAVLLTTHLRNHKHFGQMTLGSIVDNFALPEHEAEVIAAADRWLVNEKVDLIVSNQAHQDWSLAFKRNRFLRGPSNFLLAVSKELSKKLEPLERNILRIHMDRGDGDGPINL